MIRSEPHAESGGADAPISASAHARIGVIVPSLNDLRIVHTIRSIVLRDPDMLTRLYVVDGGSRPEIVQLIRRHLRASDCLISESDRGIFDALNKGLDTMREDVVTWLGADDFIARHIDFGGIAAAFEREQLDCYIFDTLFINGERTSRRTAASQPVLASFRVGRHVPHYSSYWRTSRIGDLRFDLAYPIAADQDFFCRLAASGSIKGRISNEVGTVARLGGMSSANPRRIIVANVEVFRIYRKHFGTAVGALATILKLARKIVSKFTVSRYPIIDELTDLIIR